MQGWFELSKTSDGQFRFVLKANEKQTLLASELYHTKSSAETGIAAVRTNCALEGRYEKKVASNGKFFFNLKAANGQVIGTSQMLASAEDRDLCVAATMAQAAGAALRDDTAKPAVA